MKWMRKCQECGHEQEDKLPDRSKELPAAYTERKCKNCKSSAHVHEASLSGRKNKTQPTQKCLSLCDFEQSV